MIFNHLFVVGHFEANLHFIVIGIAEREVVIAFDNILDVERVGRKSRDDIHEFDAIVDDILLCITEFNRIAKHGQFAEYDIRNAQRVGELEIVLYLVDLADAGLLEDADHTYRYESIDATNDVGKDGVVLDGFECFVVCLE